ncbi:MAG: hypothetical protein ABSH47_25860 [Bryobacteraceae bacterium]|jgi:hypothetical protein
MYRILAFMLLVPSSVPVFAAAGEAEYQLAWTTGNGTVYGDVFKATPEDASKRLAWANRFDSSAKHWLIEHSAASMRKTLIAEPVADRRRPGILYGISVASVLGANVMDIASSYGKQEANPLLKGSGGTFDARSVMLKSSLLGGLQVSNFLLVRKHPELSKRAMVMNFVATAVFAGLAVHNFGVHAGH